MTQAERDLHAVREFRNRLVRYMALVLQGAEDFLYPDPDGRTVHRLADQRPALVQEYGRLFHVINRYGGMSMSSPAAGVIVHDVVADAISNPGAFSYHKIAQLAEQHLDTVIGRLEAAVVRRSDPGRWYRVTSLLFWLERLLALLKWLLTTARGRVVGLVSLLVAAVVGGVASGAAQAWFERFLAGR